MTGWDLKDQQKVVHKLRRVGCVHPRPLQVARGMGCAQNFCIKAYWRCADTRLLRLFFVGCGIGNRDHFVLAGEDQERVLEHKSQQEQISSIPGQDNGNLGRRLSFCLAMCNHTW